MANQTQQTQVQREFILHDSNAVSLNLETRVYSETHKTLASPNFAISSIKYIRISDLCRTVPFLYHFKPYIMSLIGITVATCRETWPEHMNTELP